MKPEELLKILNTAGKLKVNTRHNWTEKDRKESVADHSWRLALMAMLLDEVPEYQNLDMNRVLNWVNSFPSPEKEEWLSLLQEMIELKTPEAKLYKALDKLEAVISHNEADIDSWLPLEYDLQMTYGQEEAAFSPWLRKLRELVDQWTKEKIAAGSKE